MAFDKINWGTLLVIVPLSHLALVSIYLWCWFFGFGAHISVLADARDTFSLSISELIPIYLGSLILPLVIIGFRYTSKYPSPQAKLDAMTDPDERQSYLAFMRLMRWLVLAGVVLNGGMSGFGIYHYHMLGVSNAGPLTFFVFEAGFLFLIAIYFRADLSQLQWEAVLLIGGLIIAASSTGFSGGQSARHRTYQDASSRFMHCGQALVIRRFGDSFVGVLKNDQKVITDSKCKIVMVIPPHRQPHRAVMQWWWPFLRYEPIKPAPAKAAPAITAPGTGSPRQTTQEGG